VGRQPAGRLRVLVQNDRRFVQREPALTRP
jgi:hypothetical protein